MEPRKITAEKRPCGKLLLEFALVSDTHVNQSEHTSTSPYACNALANARARYLFAQVASREPEFVVHIGDMINPIPELPSYVDAVTAFKDLTEPLTAPLYLVPGNHDIGDKPVDWMPAGTVSKKSISLYESHFGKTYYSFDCQGVHFVVINSSIINSKLEIEGIQRIWLERDLRKSSDKRIFICIHYPLFVCYPNENGSYDNIDEPGRSWLLNLVKAHKIEAIFCGHVHNFWYHLLEETEIYVLFSSSFIRHDYSEFFRVEPGSEFGRNDQGKLGYAFVRVYESGHVVEYVRSYGKTLERGQAITASGPRLSNVHSKTSTVTSLGVDLRHPWAEEMQIAPSGAVDEFERKWARNDYPLLALWEMGIRRMRIPIQDILDEKTRRRMIELRKTGHVFHIYCYQLPNGEQIKKLKENNNLIDAFEIIININDVDGISEKLRILANELDCMLYLSRTNKKLGGTNTEGHYNHLISHGFTIDELEDIEKLHNGSLKGAVGGFVVRVSRDEDPFALASSAVEWATKTGLRLCLYIRTASASPAEAHLDDGKNGLRTASAVVSALASNHVDVILDTFDDIDRGYFVRSGLVDRRFNPRIGSHIVRNLVSLMADRRWEITAAPTVSDGLLASATSEDGQNLLLFEHLDAACAFGPAGEARWASLVNGRLAAEVTELEREVGGPIAVLSRG